MGIASGNLQGKSILVAEDEYFLARDLADELQRQGAIVVGPVATVADARELARSTEVSGAILDIRLGDELAFGVADELAVRHVPFIFATGFAKAIVPERHRAIGFFEKPFDLAAVIGGLSAAEPETVSFRDYNPREMSLWATRMATAEATFRCRVVDALDKGVLSSSEATHLREMKAALAAMRAQPGNLALTVQPWLTKNYLLARLPDRDFAALAPHLEPCEVRAGAAVAGDADQNIYFPETAILAVFSERGGNVDLGPIGWDGAAGLPALHGNSPFRFVVTERGMCLRLPVRVLADALQRSQPLWTLLMSHDVERQAEIAEIARVNALGTTEQRLARYLLAYRDRSLGDGLRLTHSFLSSMLGTRRPSITEALHLLEGRGAIRNTRGLVIIRDRRMLRQISGVAHRPSAFRRDER
jgi:CRP-like cAMP-binding protein/ActR/RegA family two-component response regulator